MHIKSEPFLKVGSTLSVVLQKKIEYISTVLYPKILMNLERLGAFYGDVMRFSEQKVPQNIERVQKKFEKLDSYTNTSEQRRKMMEYGLLATNATQLNLSMCICISVCIPVYVIVIVFVRIEGACKRM